MPKNVEMSHEIILKHCFRTDGITDVSEFPDPDASDEEDNSEEESGDETKVISKVEVIDTEKKEPEQDS